MRSQASSTRASRRRSISAHTACSRLVRATRPHDSRRPARRRLGQRTDCLGAARSLESCVNNSCVTAGGVAGHLSDFRETYGTAPAFTRQGTQLRPGRAWRLVDSYGSKPPRHQLQLLVQRVVRVTGGSSSRWIAGTRSTPAFRSALRSTRAPAGRRAGTAGRSSRECACAPGCRSRSGSATRTIARCARAPTSASQTGPQARGRRPRRARARGATGSRHVQPSTPTGSSSPASTSSATRACAHAASSRK